jgi:hypothetical protein
LSVQFDVSIQALWGLGKHVNNVGHPQLSLGLMLNSKASALLVGFKLSTEAVKRNAPHTIKSEVRIIFIELNRSDIDWKLIRKLEDNS